MAGVVCSVNPPHSARIGIPADAADLIFPLHHWVQSNFFLVPLASLSEICIMEISNLFDNWQ